jgi:hypothetical protein
MTMGNKIYQKIATILLDGAQPMDVLSQHLPPNPASRCLSRPSELSDLLRQTITQSYMREKQ